VVWWWVVSWLVWLFWCRVVVYRFVNMMLMKNISGIYRFVSISSICMSELIVYFRGECSEFVVMM